MFKKNLIMVLLGFFIIFCSLTLSHAVVKASGTTSAGWKQISQSWYYINSGGSKVINTWEQDSSGKWFYLGSNGVMVTNTWAQDTLKCWFYLGSDGAMVTNTWKMDSSKRWFYLGSDGDMLINAMAQDSSRQWFYLGSDGAMVINTLAQNASTKQWSYFGSTGAMTTIKNSWKQNPSGIWYYFGSDGAEVMSKWVDYNGKSYYLNAGGDMAFNTTTPDGSKVGPDGAKIIITNSMTFNKTTDILAIGGTDTLIASINQTTTNSASLKWTSSNSAVVTVSSVGILSALSGGTAIISAISADGVLKASCTVTVNPKTSYKFAIDIGHNVSYDSGAVGIGNENTMNMAVGTKVIAKLKALGYQVISVLPSSASSLDDSLSQRVNAANQANANLYVSIHFNKFDGTAHGTEVWIGSESSRKVATTILNNIVALGYTNRGVKVQGIDGSHLYVLNNTTMPALLIEGCFIDSKTDMAIYNPDTIATAIVNGLISAYPN